MAAPLFAATHNDLNSAVLEIEQLMLANSGEDPFEEILKLIVAKLYDEYGQTDPTIVRFRDFGDADATRVHINALLTQAIQEWPGIFEEDTVSRLTADHLRLCIGPLIGIELHQQNLSVLDNAFEHLLTRTAKGSMGQYFTPRHVIDMCVKALRPQPGKSLLDPACGSGGFLLHAWQHVKESAPNLAVSDYYGFDFDNKAVRIAKVLTLLGTERQVRILKLNSLDGREWDSQRAKHIVFNERVSDAHDGNEENGWKLLEGLHFDFILTNPPFAGRVHDSSVLARYAVAQRTKSRNMDRDLLFVERCVKALNEGGRLGIVLPHGVLCNSNTRFVRDWLFENTKILGVVGLHPFTFLPHTGTKTSVLFVERASVLQSVDYPIFFAVSERPGKNSAGEFTYRKPGVSAPEVDHDLTEIAQAFAIFLAEPDAFATSSSELGSHISIQRSSSVRKSGRLDAEYFNPRSAEIEDTLRKRASGSIRSFVSSQIGRFKAGSASEFSYIDISCVDPDTGIAKPQRLASTEAPSRAQYVVKQGDVLVSTVRPERNSVCLVREADADSVASSGFCVLRPQSLAPEYLFAYCKTEHFRRVLCRYVASSMYPAVSDADVLDMPIVIPDDEKIAAIAAKVSTALRQIDEGNKLLRQAISEVEAQTDDESAKN